MLYPVKHPQKVFNDIGPDLFIQLRAASALDHDAFMHTYVPVLERVVFAVQEAPLCKELFSQPGGAILYAIRAGLMAARICDGTIFTPTASSRERMLLEPQYRFAAFLAAVSSSVLLVNHSVQITIDDKPWSANGGIPLYEAAKDIGTYSIGWKPASVQKPSAMSAVAVLPLIFRASQFSGFHDDVVLHLCDAINPSCVQRPGESSLARTVRVAQEKTREQEEKRMQLAFLPRPNDGGGASMPADDSADLAVAIAAASSAAAADPGKNHSPNFGRMDAAAPDVATVPIKDAEILSWIKVVSKAMAQELTFNADGTVAVSKKALSYGVSAATMYGKIHEAGLVVKKHETGFVGTVELATEFHKYLPKSGS